MKKGNIILKTIGLLLVMVIFITGCGNNNTQEDYTEAMEEIRNTKFVILGDYTIGEYLDCALTDAKWTEEDNYTGDRGKGAVKVVGKDKNTGESIEILWVKEMTNGLKNESNIDYIIIDGEKTDSDAMAYTKYIQYLQKYKKDLDSAKE